jgi:hypothetical protein
MKLAYFDCFAGAGGDMIVASLLDAGCDFEALRAMLARLGLEGYDLSVEQVRRGGLAGTRFNVRPQPPHGDGAAGHHVRDDHEHPHRRLADILEMIDRAGLPTRAADRARRVFERLAAAEAKVHRISTEEVHFHEVGAVDSIIDIVGAAVALELLGIDRVLCSPIPLGSGTVACEHGLMPVPAPATAELMRGLPVRDVRIEGEATTPTAAAFFAALSEGFGPLPPMDVRAIGYGAGTREGTAMPNLLRVFVGEMADEGSADSVVELSANVDDCSGEVLGAAMEALLSAGALDAWANPIVMKKSRPAWQISVLARPADADEMERILFAQTTTFGVRRGAWSRRKLHRSHQAVETPYGPVRVKVGRLAGRVVTASPEFEDCRRAAEAHHLAVREVIRAAEAAFRETCGGP